MIKKVLIANRNEIASRLIATCTAEGIETVSIYTKEDILSPYVYQATEAHALSQTGALGYINQDEIISIAKKSGANAIHPGYGFLSENAQFAQKVIDHDLIWIGPSPKNIRLMGDKVTARKTMERLGVPIIPGHHCYDTNEKSKNAAKQFSDSIGYPIILKSALGGGGKAMRKINTPCEFDAAWVNVISESKNLFGSTDIFIEKYIKNGRHVEIQIVGDGSNAIHLYERECSIQRRNQKIIEEAPCKFLSRGTLQNMYAVSVNAAKRLGYNNLGTIEFIVTPQEEFYFLEMNTRLQVEHTVTEYITGIDLVWLQLELANGNKLPLRQSDVSIKGHSIECRIMAEDENFIPSTGTINNLVLPNMPNIRHDHTLEVGTEISPYFDSMISKLISYGYDRNKAKNNMLNALNNFSIDGINHNIDFLKAIMTTDDWQNGQIHTQWLETHNIEMPTMMDNNIAIVAFILAQENKQAKASPVNNWKTTSWR